MKELVLHMYRTLLSKKYKSEKHAKLVIAERIKAGATREEAIVSIYVGYVDVLLGMAIDHPDDAEDLQQLEIRH